MTTAPFVADVFTRALALLAFVVGFYALVARERKTPYLTNSLYTTAFLIFLASVLQLLVQFTESNHPTTTWVLQTGAKLFLLLGALNITYGIWRIHNRHVNFRDDNLIKNIAAIRKLRGWLRTLRQSPSYEYDPPKLFPTLAEAIEGINLPQHEQFRKAISALANDEDDKLSRAVAHLGGSLMQSDDLLIRLALTFLDKGWSIQYATCIRHPVELIDKLKRHVVIAGGDHRELLKQIVVVDAYTPHFGFTDSVHSEKTAELKKSGVHCVTSAPSYAGIHTATAKAFNTLKKQSGKGQSRRPTFIIYEGAYALVDLESAEQYRIFVRHVLPSERMWGGMLTFFIEPTIGEQESAILRTYTDVFYEQEEKRTDDSGQQASTGVAEFTNAN